MSIDSKGLNHFLNKLGKLRKNKNVICNKIVENLADQGADILQNKYNALNPDDISNNPIPIVYSEKTDNTAHVIAQGKGVAYIEFGTGNIGKQTVSSELLQKKQELGLKPYNSGKTVQDNVPILDVAKSGKRNKYRRVRGWYKPEYALTTSERIRYQKWVAGLNMVSSSRRYVAVKRAIKYTHGTEGIKAGQQIYDTARQLEKIAPEVVKTIINEELK